MAVLGVFWAGSIHVDPLDRVGQVSGLAALQLRYSVIVLVLVAILVVSWRLLDRSRFAQVTRLCCAALAGLMGAFVGGGIVVALSGTTWPINFVNGDAGVLSNWASTLITGAEKPPNIYPPLMPQLLAWWAEWQHGGNTSYAFKDFQVFITAITGPCAYLSWRMLLRPTWALGIGVVASLPLVHPYKPYTSVVLVVLLPVLVKGIEILRGTPTMGYRRLVTYGALFGAGLSFLFQAYSGWFVWSAIGVLASILITMPWRTGLKRASIFLGVTVAVFLALSMSYLNTLLSGVESTPDNYFYFDTYSDPAYFAAWKDDMQGNTTTWPPLGELGGVGMFSIVLFLGLGVALALGIRRSAVITLTMCLVGSWLMRFWYASHMYRDQLVQLYPRTNAELLYCFLLLCGVAVYLVTGRVREYLEQRPEAVTVPASRRKRRVGQVSAAGIGAFSALAFLFGAASSSTVDRIMPVEPVEGQATVPGNLSWTPHTIRELNGKCPKFAPDNECRTVDIDWLNASIKAAKK